MTKFPHHKFIPGVRQAERFNDQYVKETTGKKQPLRIHAAALMFIGACAFFAFASALALIGWLLQ